MSDKQPANPYASSDLLSDARATSPDSPPGAPPKIVVAKRNIVGLVLTALGMGAFEITNIGFFKIFRDFNLALPLITRSLENDWLVYGTIVGLLATFLAGLLARTKSRSVTIGNLGLLGLLLTLVYVVMALFLPLISLINSLT